MYPFIGPINFYLRSIDAGKPGIGVTCTSRQRLIVDKHLENSFNWIQEFFKQRTIFSYLKVVVEHIYPKKIDI